MSLLTNVGLVGQDASGAQFPVAVGPNADAVAAVAGVKATGTLTVSAFGSIVTLTAASGTVTFSGQPSDGDTVTVAGIVYTFKNTPTRLRDVPILGSATLTAQAFKAAVNNTALGVTGVAATGASTTITLTAIAGGTGGNAITLAKSGTNLAVSGATLSGGLNPDTIVVGGATFTFVTSASSGFNIQVGASNNATAANIAAAVQANSQKAHCTAVAALAVVTFTFLEFGTLGNSNVLTAANGTAFSVSAFSGGVNASPATGTYGLLVKQEDGVNGATVHRAFANVAASGTDTSLVAATPGKKIRVIAASLQCGGTATAITFNSKGGGVGVAISPTYNDAIDQGPGLQYNPAGWFETNAGEALTTTTGAGSATAVLVVYVLV